MSIKPLFKPSFKPLVLETSLETTKLGFWSRLKHNYYRLAGIAVPCIITDESGYQMERTIDNKVRLTNLKDNCLLVEISSPNEQLYSIMRVAGYDFFKNEQKTNWAKTDMRGYTRPFGNDSSILRSGFDKKINPLSGLKVLSEESLVFREGDVFYPTVRFKEYLNTPIVTKEEILELKNKPNLLSDLLNNRLNSTVFAKMIDYFVLNALVSKELTCFRNNRNIIALYTVKDIEGTEYFSLSVNGKEVFRASLRVVNLIDFIPAIRVVIRSRVNGTPKESINGRVRKLIDLFKSGSGDKTSVERPVWSGVSEGEHYETSGEQENVNVSLKSAIEKVSVKEVVTKSTQPFNDEIKAKIKERFNNHFKRLGKVYSHGCTTYDPLWISPIVGNPNNKIRVRFIPKDKTFEIMRVTTGLFGKRSIPLLFRKEDGESIESFLNRFLVTYLTLIYVTSWPESREYIEGLTTGDTKEAGSEGSPEMVFSSVDFQNGPRESLRMFRDYVTEERIDLYDEVRSQLPVGINSEPTLKNKDGVSIMIVGYRKA